MTKDKSIFIKNIYYMLSYAFQILRQSNYESIAAEDFDHIQDLFAAILAKGTAQQIKQGLYREYVSKREVIPTLRGKIDLPETIKSQIQHKQLLGCEFDQLSENNLFNQIIKTTIYYLIKDDGVDEDRKIALKKVNLFLNDIDILKPSEIPWRKLHYQRNNRNYEMLMNICYFVVDGMLQTTEKGDYKMAAFSDEHMAKLYEKFVLEYYSQNHTYLSEVKAAQIKWDLKGEKNESMIKFLPIMQTDIFLRLNEKILIIDTKYYGQTMQQQYDKETLRSANMYQIYTYVKNQDSDHTGNVAGLLLYAKTNEDITPDCIFNVDGNPIGAKTLDLNTDFKMIAMQLDSIAEEYFNEHNGTSNEQ